MSKSIVKGSNHRRCSVRNDVLQKSFLRKSSRPQPTILLKKRLCHWYFPANFAKTCNFIKKETLVQVFFYEFCKASIKTPILQTTCG